MLLVGENGTGNTCTLRALRRRLPETDYRLTYCHNATLSSREAVEAVLRLDFLADASNVEGWARP